MPPRRGHCRWRGRMPTCACVAMPCRSSKATVPPARRRSNDASPAAPPRTLRPFGRVHIVGIGGIGMSGIAEVMHVMGYEVQGSDLGENANTRRLSDMGVPVMIGHREENIAGAGVVTVSSAVTQDNVEMLAARGATFPWFAAPKCWPNSCA